MATYIPATLFAICFLGHIFYSFKFVMGSQPKVDWWLAQKGFTWLRYGAVSACIFYLANLLVSFGQ